MTKIKPIRSDDDLTAALARIDELWSADPGTPEGDELDVLCDLVEHYENQTYPVEPMEPVDFLHQHMEATGRSPGRSGRTAGLTVTSVRSIEP